MHRPLASFVVAAATLGLLAEPSAAQSQLDSIRSEVRTPSPDEASAEPTGNPERGGGRCHDDEDDEDDSVLGELVVGALLLGLSSPFWGPACAMGDDYCHEAGFARFPYEDGCQGYLLVPSPEGKKCWSGQLAMDAGTDLDELTRFHSRALLELGPTRLGIDSETSYWQEDTDDHLWLGDFNIVFRFAQSPSLVMRAGLGVNWMSDDVGDDVGFNFTYGGDWFPVNPLVVSAHIDWGTLGQASLFHGQATFGVQWHGMEVYSGYDYFSLNGDGNNFFLAGMRIWL